MSRPRRTLSTREHGVGDRRVMLCPLSEADLPLIEPWYSRAAATMAGLRPDRLEADLRQHFEEAQSRPGRELLTIELAGNGELVGLLDRRAPYPDQGWLTVGFLVIAERHRGRGLGSEAVLELEAEVRRRGLARRLAAGVTADAGRALYFWLRLGYRPLLRADLPWPSPTRGVVWMVREMEQEGL